MTTSRSRAMTLLLAAFAVGLVVGAGGLTMLVKANKADWLMRMGRSGPRQGAGSGYGGVLDRRLHWGLDATRKDSISAVARRGMAALDTIQQPLWPAIDSIWQRVAPAVDARRKQTRDEIRALLTPAQQQQYDSLNQADDAQRRKIHEQGGRGGRGGRGGPGGSGGQGGPGDGGRGGGPGPRGDFNRDPL